jgi:hypothetical protein
MFINGTSPTPATCTTLPPAMELTMLFIGSTMVSAMLEVKDRSEVKVCTAPVGSRTVTVAEEGATELNKIEEEIEY